MQLIISIIIIIASIATVALFGVPQYNMMKDLGIKKSEYTSVLANAKTLAEKRKSLLDKRNTVDTVKLEKLEKMLPNSPENVALILELDALARTYGLSLQNVKVEDAAIAAAADISKKPITGISNEVGTLNINFTIIGPYINFTDFVRAAEKNLRMIDIQKISFTTQEDKDQYQYTMNVRTYWLK
jgi:Tfp pilus assembly protein PilO